MTLDTPPQTGFNWRDGTWTGQPEAEVQAELVISGDWAPIRAFAQGIADSPEAVYGDLLPVLRASDLRITNLECPLDAGGPPVWKSGSVFKGAPGHIKGLTSVPFEVVTLANNHVFDFGPGGFERTLNLLGEHGIRGVGAGLDPKQAHQPLILDLKGTRIGIVNFSEGEDLTAALRGPGVFGWELDRVVATIEALRPDVDMLLVVCHCGVEYIAFPPPYVAGALRRTVDAGADLVIAHHPHVPQGIQIYRGVPICYSLGNFVFYQETGLVYRKLGYLVKAGISHGLLARIQIIPYRIGEAGLSLLRDGQRARFLGALRAVSAPLAAMAKVVSAWHAQLRWQGREGFRAEVGMILEKMLDEPEKGAAMFRNRLTTLQHREQWVDLLTRIMDGSLGSAPAWASELVLEWQTATALPNRRPASRRRTGPGPAP